MRSVFGSWLLDLSSSVSSTTACRGLQAARHNIGIPHVRQCTSVHDYERTSQSSQSNSVTESICSALETNPSKPKAVHLSNWFHRPRKP